MILCGSINTENHHCIVDPEEFKCLKIIAELNEEADNIYDLYKNPNPACQDGSEIPEAGSIIYESWMPGSKRKQAAINHHLELLGLAMLNPSG